jgi:uncharacterized membrane protein YhaH (DUF805 family)
MMSLKEPLGRRDYVLYGAGLMALKVAIDWVVAMAFGRRFSLAFYLSPTDSLALTPHGPSGAGTSGGNGAAGYWLTVIGVALPFIALGLALTVKRLRDARLPGSLAALFFMPFVKFPFFALLVVVPSRQVASAVDVEQGPFRSSTLEIGPPPSARRSERGRRWIGMLLGVLAGAGVALFAMGVSVGLLREYGAPLTIAAPAIAGFVSTLVYARFCSPTAGRTLLVTTASFVLGFGLLIASAIEGLGCVFMAAPLFLIEALVGAAVAHAVVTRLPKLPESSIAACLVVLPLSFAANGVSPLPPEQAAPVESEIVVHAPADLVWKRVIAFPPLPRPTEAVFRAGIAAPLSATIDGEGVGAVRRCIFTTGVFVEPITVWQPGRQLSFSVTSQPDPMTEWTLYKGPRPLHLDGYLESTRGEFELQPTGDGSTRLIGRTWYQVHMRPVGYWRLWGNSVIHTIHMRVLRHIAHLAEEDAGEGSMAR